MSYFRPDYSFFLSVSLRFLQFLGFFRASGFIFLPSAGYSFRWLSLFRLLLSFEDFLFASRFLQSSHAGPSLFPPVCHFIS